MVMLLMLMLMLVLVLLLFSAAPAVMADVAEKQATAAQKVWCDAEEIDALQTFKAHIEEDREGIFHSWTGNGTNCCAAWEGIECDPVTGRVVRLQLTAHSLGRSNESIYMRGTLSPALARLSFLETLVITGFRQIRGPIPASLGRLRRLRQLYLENNKLSGAIPASLGDLRGLETLSLNGNRLSGAVPPSLAGLPELIQLNLARNRLTGPLPSLPPRLQFLDLNGNLFSGQLPESPLPSTLTLLDLSDNAFTGPIPESLASLTALRELSLSGNRLNGQIPSWLGRLPVLGTLSLSENALSGAVPASLADAPALWALNLSRNALVDPLPRQLGDSPALLSLDVSYNRLRLGRVPGWLSRRAMADVHLAGCGVGGSLADWAASANTEMLTSLDLSDNALTGPIGGLLRNMTRLEKIRLANNRLCSDVAEVVLPENTVLADLRGNRLYGSVGNIVKDVANFSACADAGGCLEYLDVSRNELGGGVPELDAERRLRHVDLSHNRLSGSVPASISMLKEVTFLDVSYNRLTGPVPASVGGLTELAWLDLSSNGLAGPLPQSVANLTKLRHLNVRRNHLCGHIPPRLSVFRVPAFVHNDCLCGPPLSPCKA